MKHKYLIVGIAASLIGSLHATVMKYAFNGGVNPDLYNFMRFGIAALVSVPFIFKHTKSINRVNLKYAILMGVNLALAVFCYSWAIRLSQASYVAIIMLISPIIFVIVSVLVDKGRLEPKSIAGLSLAVTGSMLIFILPIAIKQNSEFNFYGTATMLLIAQSVFNSGIIITGKKADLAGMNMICLIAISSLVCLSIFGVLSFRSLAGGLDQLKDIRLFYGAAFSGLIIGFALRPVDIRVYEKLGPSVIAVLNYLSILASIVVPIVALGEKISQEMVIGASLIMLGVYVAEHHKSKSHKYFHIFKHH
jgi:drug/metabolite transporter (DMT)-like permease